MRDGCYECVLKHLGQAMVLMDEAVNGYPLHKWLAVGHLAEAESEIADFAPTLMHAIRALRKIYIDGGKIKVMSIIAEVERIYYETQTVDEADGVGDNDADGNGNADGEEA